MDHTSPIWKVLVPHRHSVIGKIVLSMLSSKVSAMGTYYRHWHLYFKYSVLPKGAHFLWDLKLCIKEFPRITRYLVQDVEQSWHILHLINIRISIYHRSWEVFHLKKVFSNKATPTLCTHSYLIMLRSRTLYYKLHLHINRPVTFVPDNLNVST